MTIDRSKRPPTGPDITPPPINYKPDPPAILGEHGRRKWKKTVNLLVSESLLTKFFLDSLLTLCIEWERYIACIETLRVDGETFTTESGYIQKNPAAAQANTSFANYTKIATLFGLDPTSIKKLKRVAAVKEEKNAFDGV